MRSGRRLSAHRVKATTEDLRRAYCGRFDVACPLVVTLNPTPEEQTADLPKRMSDLDPAALDAVVDRVNEGVPETPVVAEAEADDDDSGAGERSKADLKTKLEAVANGSSVDSFVASRDRFGNLPPEAEIPFAFHSAGQRLHLDFTMDYALKMKKMAAAAAAAAANAAAAEKDCESHVIERSDVVVTPSEVPP